MAVHADRHHVRWSIRMIKNLSILAAIAGLSFLPSIANAQERLGDGAMGALAGALVAAARSAWLRAASLATRPGRRLRRAGVSGTGIIATPIIGTIHHATRLRKR